MDDEAAPSPWAPLRYRVFRWLWIASIASNIGGFMHTTGAAWLMTELTRSPALVALLQTVWAGPGFLLALPAGALADIVDRRRLLLVTQTFALVIAALLGLLTVTHHVDTTSLLLLTFLMSIGLTLNMPAWTSITPELVSREELPQAVALNSISMNLAQSVGPAIGGIVIAAAGSGAVFLVNAASFVGVVAVIAAWRRPRQSSDVPAEQMVSAIRTGVRYAANSPPLLTLLARIGLFVVFSSSLTALLPLVARNRLGVHASQFGLLEGALGFGAVAMASVMPRVRKKLGADGMLVLGSVTYCVGLVVLAQTHSLAVACAGLLVAGAASIAALTTVFATLQGILPAWVRGRGLAVAMLTVWLVTAPAAYGWGSLAAAVGLSRALTIASIAGAVAALAAARPLRIGGFVDADITPVPLALPMVAFPPAPLDGPVLVTVEWRIDPSRTAEFTEAMDRVRRHRRRDGAISWGLYGDIADPGRMLESFTVASWAEHERQHGRSVASDAAEEAAARALLVGGEPVVTHYVKNRPQLPTKTHD